jgi:mannose-6-phosphate isomerase-like protein (cupin superfamily)
MAPSFRAGAGGDSVFTRVKSVDLVAGSGRTARFEGKDHQSGVSFFLVDNDPGQGPGLHRHPYSETWVVRAGSATITADGETVEAVAGDIVTVTAGTAHKFRNSGPDRLEMVCIHASPRMIQEDLE